MTVLSTACNLRPPAALQPLSCDSLRCADEAHLQSAIDSCPVSCIHWIDSRQELAALEYVMQKRLTQRTNVGVMMAGQGASADVFAATAVRAASAHAAIQPSLHALQLTNKPN